MATLTAGVTASARNWHISAPLAGGVVYVQVDSEVVKVHSSSPDGLAIYVSRGVVDTAWASHSNGATLTAYTFPSVGGGSTPTLAEVLGEGNDPAGDITAAGDVNGSGGTLLIGPQSDHSGKVVLEGGSGAIAQPGGAAEIRGGFGDNGNDAAAYINVSGGGWEGTGIPGGVTIHSNGSHGSFGQVGAWKDGYFAWTNPLSTGAGAPGGTFTTPLYVDTTDRHLYAWDGSAYVLVSDYA